MFIKIGNPAYIGCSIWTGEWGYYVLFTYKWKSRIFSRLRMG